MLRKSLFHSVLSSPLHNSLPFACVIIIKFTKHLEPDYKIRSITTWITTKPVGVNVVVINTILLRQSLFLCYHHQLTLNLSSHPDHKIRIMTSWIMTSNEGVNVVEIKTIIPHLFLCYHQIYKNQIFSFKLTQSQDTKHQDLDNHQKCLSKCSSNHAPIFCVIIKNI